MKISTDMRLICLILFLFVLEACGEKWLEAKPDKSLIVPKSLTDYQLLLDNYNLFNNGHAAGLGEIGAGDFYITYASWQSLFNAQERSAYIWAPTNVFYNGEQSIDWVNGYKRILNANVVLEGVEKIKPAPTEQQDWSNIKGSALFFRAFDFFNMAQEYCVAYDANTASKNLGLPLRLESDVNVKVNRSSLQLTYDRIIADLLEAGNLLGSKPQYKTRPSKEAVYALLARTYLAMENYEEAGRYAGMALEIQSELMDYSKLNALAAYPISRFNTEVIFHSVFSWGIFTASRLIVDPALYSDYAPDDYRRSVFFTGNANITFKGSYNGDRSLFGGLATDEIYLIRAEAKARNKELIPALADLNHLRRNRWKGNYQNLVSSDPDIVLDYILKERRRELIFRGIRWSDLRRLNKDSRFAVVLSRTLNGITYILPSNGKRYVFPIDEQEIRLNGTAQNDR